MRNGYHILRPGMPGLLLGSTIALAGWFSPVVFADGNTANLEIRARVTSSCNVSVDNPTVDLGEISIREFEGKQAGEELDVNEASFEVYADCSGTDQYELTFTVPGSENTAASCVVATSKDMQFCLYEGSKKLDFSTAATAMLEGSQAIETRTIRVLAAAGEGLPEPGVHTAALVITIAPD